MNEEHKVINDILSANSLIIPDKKRMEFDEFLSNQEILTIAHDIAKKQQMIMDKWKIINRISDITGQALVIPNATISKPYSTVFDLNALNLLDIEIINVDGLNEIGLNFNREGNIIEGIPNTSGDLQITLLYKIIGQSDDEKINEKNFKIVINPDPKTLWKDIPSNKNDEFWKEDDVNEFGDLGEKKIIVSSKRGRSHKNVGSFRDDDFAFKHIDKTGWSIVGVSDGAGSYSLSRKGSQIACNTLIDYFENHSDAEKDIDLNKKLEEFSKTKDESLLKEIEVLGKQNLYKAAVHVHNSLKEFSEKTFIDYPDKFNNPKAKSYLDYFHSTLIFVAFKRFEFGYAIFSFGVGDCPIAIMNKEKTESTLLNWLDVGEFGGGTRFITQPEIFHSTEHPMVSRFNFKIVEDFSYLFLMTDGIYDPKFVVEANLEKSEKWIEFINDLNGDNEDNINVELTPENEKLKEQLSEWMDFWSPGNHDDRTLAIVF
jgi:serine/threonine protein phosphatase PrpC